MKKIFVLSAGLLVIGILVKAGNPDRAGEAGAYELLINPWARSSGLFGMNSARIEGVESMRFNVAGLARVQRTEAVFSRAHWMQGAGVYFNSFGVAQKFGKAKKDALALNFVSMDLGEIEITTTSQPEGGLGTYKPQFFNIGVAYSRAFSNSIYGGFVFRIISERIADISAFGIAADLGIQYITGPLDNIRFGIALRNVGTPMKFGGDGFSFRGDVPDGDYQATISQRTEKFELPSQLNIGAAYDLYVDNIKNDKDIKAYHRLTIVANFTSNSFGKDYVGGGLEYSYRDYFMLRAGYRWEDGITKAETRTSVYTGFAFGGSFQVPLKKDGPSLGIDYAYLTTSPFKGTHVFGVRFDLGPDKSAKPTTSRKEERAKRKEEKEERIEKEVKLEEKAVRSGSKKDLSNQIDALESQKDSLSNSLGRLDQQLSDLQSENANLKRETTDSDGDGVFDKFDKCPGISGTVKNNGCPELTEEEKRVVKDVYENVEFESKKAALKSSSLVYLDSLVTILNNNKNAKIKLSGNTATEKTADLLTNRSKAVEEYLISKGIAKDRIIMEPIKQAESSDRLEIEVTLQ